MGENYDADQGNECLHVQVGHHVSIATNQYTRHHYQYDNDKRTQRDRHTHAHKQPNGDNRHPNEQSKVTPPGVHRDDSTFHTCINVKKPNENRGEEESKLRQTMH